MGEGKWSSRERKWKAVWVLVDDYARGLFQMEDTVCCVKLVVDVIRTGVQIAPAAGEKEAGEI